MWHEINYLWINYFWSSLKGNGPEAGFQTVIYAAIAVVFIPAVRKFFKRHFASVHAKLDEAHRKIDHVIAHSDIPPLPPKEES